MSQDYYSILGLDRNANGDHIKQSYRKLALKHHPDRGGDPEQFKRISEAYAVLSDPKKRKQYDISGTDLDHADMMDFMTMFSDVFQMRTQRRTKDRHITTHVTLEEVMMGTIITVRLKRKVISTSPVSCPACRGKGSVLGFIAIMMTTTRCAECDGMGVLPHESDFALRDEILEIPIPPGIANSHEIRLSGKGDEIPGFVVGDVILRIVYKEHPLYRISATDPLDIETDLVVELAEYLCGFERRLSLLDGRTLRVVVRTGTLLQTQHGCVPAHVFLPNLGLPGDGWRRGKMKLCLKISVPAQLREDQVQRIAHALTHDRSTPMMKNQCTDDNEVTVELR